MTISLTSPRPRMQDTSRRDLTAAWRHIDLVLVFSTLAVAVLGIVMVFSATKAKGAPGIADTTFLKRELVFMGVGAVLMTALALFDYQRVANWVWPIYGGALVLLVLVVSPAGQRVNGSQAWFGFGAFQMQPAEFAKIAVILALAAVMAGYKGDVDLRRLLVLLVLAGVPIGLILLQPDLGMVLIFVFVLMGMLLVGGIRVRYIVLLTLLGVAGVWGALNSNVLKDYQKERLTAFVQDRSNGASALETKNLSPDEAAQKGKATYNVDQSLNAIGAGGVSGQGYGEGKQTQLGFVPEQQTDFIFTAVAEELGFVGAATLLGLYALIMWRVWRAATLSRDLFGALLCVGVLSFLMFQVFENAGMTMQIMPVTGIPLPLMSYGGSSIITTFIAIGLVLNVGMRRFR
ncbi:MAG: rod shape-determining protein RodA [Actinobacteria bacterium]|nr:rod shape-determining protein RodA [Actinomycetota bacterium]